MHPLILSDILAKYSFGSDCSNCFFQNRQSKLLLHTAIHLCTWA